MKESFRFIIEGIAEMESGDAAFNLALESNRAIKSQCVMAGWQYEELRTAGADVLVGKPFTIDFHTDS